MQVGSYMLRYTRTAAHKVGTIGNILFRGKTSKKTIITIIIKIYRIYII